MAVCADNLLNCCLYFTANSLSREITRMAEESFNTTGFTPSQAFLMMLVVESPGISQKELAEQLHLAQSTVSRLVDALVKRKLVERNVQGKVTHVFPGDAGKDVIKPIRAAWADLYKRYSDVLGQEQGDALTRDVDIAYRKLGNLE